VEELQCWCFFILNVRMQAEKGVISLLTLEVLTAEEGNVM
jgi:hypothetical protein